MDSGAVESLPHFSNIETASNCKTVQDTAPSTCKVLVHLFQSGGCVKAFTGVESVKLLPAIAEADSDELKAERNILERAAIVLVKYLKTFLSFRCLATLFSVSEATVHRYFDGTLCPLAAVLEAAIPWPSKA